MLKTYIDNGILVTDMLLKKSAIMYWQFSLNNNKYQTICIMWSWKAKYFPHENLCTLGIFKTNYKLQAVCQTMPKVVEKLTRLKPAKCIQCHLIIWWERLTCYCCVMKQQPPSCHLLYYTKQNGK